MYNTVLKRFCIVLSVMVGLTYMPKIYAQTPCPGVCDPQPWIPVVYQVNLATDCQVSLTYEWRTCGTTSELRVIGAIIIGPCVGLVDPISVAVSIMVRSNQMLFPTGAGQPQDAAFTWVVRRPVCWQKGPGATMVPCTDECCESVLAIKNKANCDTWRIVSESTTVPPRACQISVTYMEGEVPAECSPACNEAFVLK